MIAAGDVHLGVSQDDFSKGRDRKNGVGLSMHVETDQDLSALARRVKQAGIAFDKELGPLPWGPTGFSVKDPDGLTVFVSNPEPDKSRLRDSAEWDQPLANCRLTGSCPETAFEEIIRV